MKLLLLIPAALALLMLTFWAVGAWKVRAERLRQERRRERNLRAQSEWQRELNKDG